MLLEIAPSVVDCAFEVILAVIVALLCAALDMRKAEH